MVKPPRNMEPEAVDLEKAKRSAGKAFQEDTFRNYMARKIYLQRKQFGLVLPPAPDSSLRQEELQQQLRGVRFADDVLDKSASTRKRKRKRSGLSIVLKRLKRRHGRCRRKDVEEGPVSDHQFVVLLRTRSDSEGSSTDCNHSCPGESEGHCTMCATSRTTSDCENSDLQCDISQTEFLRVEKSSALPWSSTRIRSPRPDLFFTGVVVQVNGYTNPDTDTLQRLLHKHGGDLERYETSRITHIIAEHLSFAKASIYKGRRMPTPVCYPAWIVDSVEAKKLLPHASYLIEEVRDNSSSITSFFRENPPGISGLKKGSVNRNDCDNSLELSQGDGEMFKHGDASELENSNGSGHPIVESEILAGIEGAEEAREKSPGSYVGDVDSPQKPDHAHQRQKWADAGGYSTIGRVRTTGTDPDFLDSFFATSRLSFIGSYKQRKRHTTTKVVLGDGDQRFVFHIDMDCFFASVVLRSFPEYQDKPVAISHCGRSSLPSGGPQMTIAKDSTSECATCNYHARKYGIKKGMYLGRAKELCPSLIVLQYDFCGYEEVSEKVAEILSCCADMYGGNVEHVSCDEAYLEMRIGGAINDSTRLKVFDIAESIRTEIYEATRCTATVGAASNMFLAKLAGDRVKPNKCFVVDDYRDLLCDLKLRDLHGIGYRSERKLEEAGLTSVRDVWDLADEAENELCRILGPGAGKKIHLFCRGIDVRRVEPAERKTIGAEVSVLQKEILIYFRSISNFSAGSVTMECDSMDPMA
jgi:DNA repair protein REV1